MKARGRKHTFAEKQLMERVAKEFSRKKTELGGKRAARELNVSHASFYNYAAGTDLPRMEVLIAAHEKWGIKWPLIDTSELLRTRRIRSPEQLTLAFLAAVREQDVEVVKVACP